MQISWLHGAMVQVYLDTVWLSTRNITSFFLYSYNLIFIETKMNFQNAHAISSEILACIEPGIFDTRLDSWNH